MRFMFKFHIPVETGNAAAEEGFGTLRRILDQIKPEAAYFTAENGERTAILIVNMTDLSQIPAISEPFLLAFDASVDIVPVMVAEDLMKAGPAIEAAVKNFGGVD
jgi:hypothetical protein